jgi:two-component system, LytTR family, response regulator LytT
MRVLLVDDEYLALELLEEFVGQLPNFTVIGKTKSAAQALEILESQAVDILFLDIQMPNISGLNLLKSLQRPPATIFTTAYGEYAVQAFDLNAVDYLLKPFSFERFLQAVNKAKDHLRLNSANSNLPTRNETEDFLAVKVDGRLQKISFAEILYVEGLKEYVRFVCNAKQYVAYERLKNVEEMLPNADFIRVHKSFIVAKKAVQSMEGNQLDLGKIKLPVSREKREEVLKAVFGMEG